MATISHTPAVMRDSKQAISSNVLYATLNRENVEDEKHVFLTCPLCNPQRATLFTRLWELIHGFSYLRLQNRIKLTWCSQYCNSMHNHNQKVSLLCRRMIKVVLVKYMLITTFNPFQVYLFYSATEPVLGEVLRRHFNVFK